MFIQTSFIFLEHDLIVVTCISPMHSVIFLAETLNKDSQNNIVNHLLN